MKTNIETIYKNMKPKELAGIAFSAIGKQDTNTWRACEANVGNKTYVGRDLDYTRTLQNQIDFSIMAGLQFHKYAHVCDSLMLQLQIDRIAMEKEGVDMQTIDESLQETQEQAIDASFRFRIVLSLINSLCDQYGIDKRTCLNFAEINMSAKGLESIEMPDPKQWSDLLKTYHHDYKYAFEATINPDKRDDNHAEN